MAIFYRSKNGDAMGKECSPWNKKAKQEFAIAKFGEDLRDPRKQRQAVRGFNATVRAQRKAAGLE